MQKTIDGMSLNFSYLDRAQRNPQRQLNNKWSWSSDFQYQLDFGRARTIDPFGFLPNVPVLGALSDLSFNYVPRSVSFTASAERNAQTTRSRPSGQRGRNQPYRIAYPFREQQRFNHRRNFSLQYDPFEFLSLSFDTNTRQSFDDISSSTQTNVFIRSDSLDNRLLTDVGVDPDSTESFFDKETLREYGLENSGLSSDDIGNSVFFEDRQFRRSGLDVFRDLLLGRVGPRTNDYQQRFSATLSMGWTDRSWLNWMDLKDISYQSSFQWQNGSKGSLRGAGVNNSLTMRTGVTLRPNKVWERFGFFEDLKQAQRQSGDDEQRGARRRGGEGASGEEGGEGEDGASEDDATENGGLSWDDVPLPDPMGLLRGMALMVMDINDFSVNYNGNWSGRSSNVGSFRVANGDTTGVNTSYSLLDAVRGDGPSLGYRLGLARSIDPQGRVLLGRFQVSDALTNRHRVEGRTTLSPSRSFQIDLSWDVEWSQQTNVTLRQAESEAGSPGQFTTESGENSASVWGFGSIVSLVEQQVGQLPQGGGSGSETVQPAGRVALTNASVADGFRDAFLMGMGSVGGNGFAPFPLPSWSVRYTGLSDWPLLGSIVESASLQHGYSAEFRSSFSSDSKAGNEDNAPLGPETFRRPEFKVGASRVSEQFQPLLGLDLTWPGNLETSLKWNRQVETFLRTANLKVEEVKTTQLSGTVSYRKRGLRIPVLGLGRLENQIRFSLTLSRSVNDERSYNLRGALAAAQSSEAFDPSQVTDPTNDYVTVRKQTTRLQVTPELTYRLSDRVTADLLVEYERFNGDNRQPSYTRVNGGFNVSVSITQN
jgi:cell surface protein SprA